MASLSHNQNSLEPLVLWSKSGCSEMEKLDWVFKQFLSNKRKELMLRVKAAGRVLVGPGVPDSPGPLEGRRSQGSQNPRGADSAPAIPTGSKTGRKGAGPNAFPRRPPGNELFRPGLGCGQRSQGNWTSTRASGLRAPRLLTSCSSIIYLPVRPGRGWNGYKAAGHACRS